MTTTDLTVHNGREAELMMPAMRIGQAVQRYQEMAEFVSRILKPGTDFGTIPGTSDKRVLLKPGAEKLATFFGLSKRFELIERVEDWDGNDHGGEPFFYYLYRCRLSRGDLLIAEADGSCNSRETKYRYRKAERECPACGEAAIIKGKAEYGGGWLCWKKRGGCGAKYADGDASIEEQKVGRVLNPDVADQANTIVKMAQKRALIAATLMAVNASDYFTQDLEDFGPLHGDVVDGKAQATEPAPAPAPAREPPAEPKAKAAKVKAKAKPTGEEVHWGERIAAAQSLSLLWKLWRELGPWIEAGGDGDPHHIRGAADRFWQQVEMAAEVALGDAQTVENVRTVAEHPIVTAAPKPTARKIAALAARAAKLAERVTA